MKIGDLLIDDSYNNPKRVTAHHPDLYRLLLLRNNRPNSNKNVTKIYNWKICQPHWCRTWINKM